MTTINVPDWPALLAHGDFEMDEVSAIWQGPKPMTFGAGQDWQADAGSWVFRLNDVPIHDANGSLLTLRALRAALKPPYDIVNIPVRDDGIRTPRAIAGISADVGKVPFSDTATFGDGTEFGDSIVDAVLTADAAQRDTLVTVKLTAGLTLQGGQVIGFGAGGTPKWAHLIGGAQDNGDGTFTLSKLWPPLRASYKAGQPVETEHPMVACRVPHWPALKLTMNRYTRVTLEFFEAGLN